MDAAPDRRGRGPPALGRQPDPRGPQPYPPPRAYLEVTFCGGAEIDPQGPQPLQVTLREVLYQSTVFTVAFDFHGLLRLPAGGAPLPEPERSGDPRGTVMIPGGLYPCGNFIVKYLLPGEEPSPLDPPPPPDPSSGSRWRRRDGSDDDATPRPARWRTQRYQLPLSVPQHELLPAHFEQQSSDIQNVPPQPDEQMGGSSSIHTWGFELDTGPIFQKFMDGAEARASAMDFGSSSDVDV